MLAIGEARAKAIMQRIMQDPLRKDMVARMGLAALFEHFLHLYSFTAMQAAFSKCIGVRDGLRHSPIYCEKHIHPILDICWSIVMATFKGTTTDTYPGTGPPN